MTVPELLLRIIVGVLFSITTVFLAFGIGCMVREYRLAKQECPTGKICIDPKLWHCTETDVQHNTCTELKLGSE